MTKKLRLERDKIKWEKEHQVRERKIKRRAIRLVADVEIIHFTGERDFVLLVVLVIQRSYVSRPGATELERLMALNHFTATERKSRLIERRFLHKRENWECHTI